MPIFFADTAKTYENMIVFVCFFLSLWFVFFWGGWCLSFNCSLLLHHRLWYKGRKKLLTKDIFVLRWKIHIWYFVHIFKAFWVQLQWHVYSWHFSYTVFVLIIRWSLLQGQIPKVLSSNSCMNVITSFNWNPTTFLKNLLIFLVILPLVLTWFLTDRKQMGQFGTLKYSKIATKKKKKKIERTDVNECIFCRSSPIHVPLMLFLVFSSTVIIKSSLGKHWSLSKNSLIWCHLRYRLVFTINHTCFKLW